MENKNKTQKVPIVSWDITTVSKSIEEQLNASGKLRT